VFPLNFVYSRRLAERGRGRAARYAQMSPAKYRARGNFLRANKRKTEVPMKRGFLRHRAKRLCGMRALMFCVRAIARARSRTCARRNSPREKFCRSKPL